MSGNFWQYHLYWHLLKLNSVFKKKKKIKNKILFLGQHTIFYIPIHSPLYFDAMPLKVIIFSLRYSRIKELCLRHLFQKRLCELQSLRTTAVEHLTKENFALCVFVHDDQQSLLRVWGSKCLWEKWKAFLGASETQNFNF